MRHVTQKHARGCGVASLAMTTGIGYDRILKTLAPKRIPGSEFHGTTLEMALKTLMKLKLGYRLIFNKINLDRLENDAYISVTLPCGCRHAVAWDAKAKKVRDPDPEPDGADHKGNYVKITKAYIKKHMNYIVEVIPQ